LGGFVAARHGLKAWIGWMVLAINLPNIAYVYLSQAMPESFLFVNVAVGIEQFGYGFGFTAYMLTMLYIAQGEHQTVHFAFCTGFMALGMMIPGMFSGWLQDLLGYQHFFIWVMLATLPGFLVTWLIPLDAEFGKRQPEDG
jgi:PAT family beta-lactamase induction signal transducer AmpG